MKPLILLTIIFIYDKLFTVIMSKVCIIGDGGWGTALALLVFSKETEVILWSVSQEYADELKEKRENSKFLRGIPLPAELRITSCDDDLKEAEYAIFVVPCEYLRKVAERFSSFPFKYIVSATKGIENGSLKRPSEILGEYFSEEKISVLSGPSISNEVAKNIPTTVVVASKSTARKEVQSLLMTETFRVYTSEDVIGVEMGGALKNVIAIAAGISDGLGFGTNTKSAILTRGLAEIIRLGVKLGAEKGTFSGLSGIGDLATTCISEDSRNRSFGEQLGKGRMTKDILGDSEMVVEGIATSKAAVALAEKYGVEMPITKSVFEIIHEGKDPLKAVKELMVRDPKDE